MKTGQLNQQDSILILSGPWISRDINLSLKLIILRKYIETCYLLQNSIAMTIVRYFAQQNYN